VKAASDGRAEDSFDQLERLGCIHESTPDKRDELLTAEYLASIERRENPLVVAQTRDEVAAVNDSIRASLRGHGLIGDGTTITALQAVDLTEAEKADARSYRAGQVAYFQKRYGQHRRGDCCTVLGANDRGVVVDREGRPTTIGYKHAGRLVVAESREMEIAPGDRLQLKFNGTSLDDRPLVNGELVTVREIRPDGSIEVEGVRGGRKTLSVKQRLFNRGYAVTSYGSQGKTVDTVLFADSGCRAATSAQQWYVTVSRGRRRVVVFTENKAALREAVAREGGKALALDLQPVASSAQGLSAALTMRERLRRHEELMSRDRIRSVRIAL
jgi:ATP-dependent exoDNAse (exonuclease V) alpha subunit